MSTKLKADSLSFFESIIMGVAGSAPGFSIAVAIAGLLATAGSVSPNALLIFAVPMLGIAVAYKGLTHRMPNAGAAYEWTKSVFGGFFGYFSGWALLVAAMVFMVTGSVPLGTATLQLVAPAYADNVFLTTSIGGIWFLGIGLVLITGIELTSKVQMVMSTIELGILLIISIAAFAHSGSHGAVSSFSWSWFGFNYPAGSFAASSLSVVFLYWGWDVTSNLAEETKGQDQNLAGRGGFLSIFATIASFIAFTVAALMMFSLKDASNFSDNLIYHVAIAAGLGKAGAYGAALVLILSSVATLETTMLQFSRTLFAMGRDRALPSYFGQVHEKTVTPVRTMYLLLMVGLGLIVISSFLPSVSVILNDSVAAIAVQVCYYYGLAGLVCAWVYRKSSGFTFAQYVVFPALSAIALIGLGFYAITTFNDIVKIVGIGGLAAGLLFYRSRGYRQTVVVAAE
ncbi:APC family permease [Acidocella aminolytica]|jgi:amino acid transporter|uniref:Amino acid/polyamine/organocation transporter/nucleobase cation symporters-1 (NCS1) n=1 Tax=Acidocella aminolytica 101 = DSM 11237 TaxID=1120923 RepID=A0A0D6PM75_9PROT|nr:APC family permease [Acidocella aminolytica]GAN81899.1 amino acid/polyamine/organocation transporter/nucleobase cation symporters-1 (NCS1) [Acidocella aminolytica 101 = DSM 11237]SHF20791.1 amino acid/polyamine/organocation transporter, APC superfamily (TC 2.A.3) [Acidocella aminolytica 101 = DSM 11237]